MFDIGLVKNLAFAIEQAARARGDLNHTPGDISDIQEPLELAMRNLRVALGAATTRKLWTEVQDA
jgi:hypothetical protein